MKAKQPKKVTIAATVTALVGDRQLTDESIVRALQKQFRHLTEAQARAHVSGARRATGHKAPKAEPAKKVAKRATKKSKPTPARAGEAGPSAGRAA